MGLISNFADGATTASGIQHVRANIRATLEIGKPDIFNLEKLDAANGESAQVILGNVPYSIQIKNSPVPESGVNIASFEPFSDNTERHITIIYIVAQDI